MYRFAEKELAQWQQKHTPIPLLIRGARQTGKTYLIKNFAEKNFKNFIEINFEFDENAKNHFKSLDPQEIIASIEIASNTKIIKGETLLFFDEIQICPEAIKSLRYFYEKMPGLHVVGAGSLLDFTLRSPGFSVPVGRVQYFFLGPLSFNEYLLARGKTSFYEYITTFNPKKPFNEALHNELLGELRKYLILGGMPNVVKEYLNEKSFIEAFKIQSSINLSYKDDFAKYAKTSDYEYLRLLLEGIPKEISKKFKYSRIDSDIKSRDLKRALDLLIKAQVINKIRKTSGSGLPFGANASDKDFKLLYLDLGLMQKQLGLDNEIISATDFHSIAAGALAEQFVGQELLVSQGFYDERQLYYWERSGKQATAEVDYLISIKGKIIPVEVKSGKQGKLKSLRVFMEEFKSPFGIRTSERDFSFGDGILSVPLYLVCEIKRIVEALELL